MQGVAMLSEVLPFVQGVVMLHEVCTRCRHMLSYVVMFCLSECFATYMLYRVWDNVF